MFYVPASTPGYKLRGADGVLVQINAHRNKQRQQGQAAVIRQCTGLLENGRVRAVTRAGDNERFREERFARMTMAMRFHVFSEMLEVYVAVLGIAEAWWIGERERLLKRAGAGW